MRITAVVLVLGASSLAESPESLKLLQENQFSIAVRAIDISVHCTLPSPDVVFTFVRAETESTVEELIARRPWGKDYCDWIKERVAKLTSRGGTITVVGEGRTQDKLSNELDDEGRPPPALGKRSYFTSIFDHLINSDRECVGYFEESCPPGARKL